MTNTISVTPTGITAIAVSATATAGPAAALSIAQLPSTSVVSGSTLATQPTVQLKDSFGNNVAQANVPVTVALQPPTGWSLSGTTTRNTNASGVADFTDLGISGPDGSVALRFSSGTLTTATSASITVSSAAATVVTWTNSSGGNWSTGSNWSTGAAPTSAQIASINLAGTYTVVLDANVTVAGLNIGQTTGALTLSATSRTLTVNGNTGITANGTILLTSSTLNGTGTLTNQGTLILSTATLGAGVSLANQGLLLAHGTSTISGAVTASSASIIRPRGQNAGSTALLTFADGFTNHGLIELVSADLGYTTTFAVTNGTLTNATDGTIRSAVGTGGTRTLAAQLANAGSLDVLQPLTINKPGAAHSNSAILSFTSADVTITQTGTSPSFTNTGDITLGASRTLTISGGTVDIDQGTITGPATSTLVVSGATLAFTPGNVTLPLTITTTTIAGASVTIASGQTLTLLAGGLTDPVTVQAGGTLLSLGTVNLTTVSLPAATSTLRVRGQNIGSTGSLTIANGFTNNGLVELISADLGYSVTLAVTTGTLTNAAGGTLRAAAGTGGTRTLGAQLNNLGTLELLQPLTISKAGAVHTNSAAINISAADLTITQTGTTPSFTNTGTITLGANRTWTVTGGTLDIDQGTVTGPATSTLVVNNASLAFTTANVTLPLTLTSTTIAGGSVTIPTGETLTLLGGGLSDPVTIQNGGTLLSLGTVSLTGAVTLQTGGTLRPRGQNIGSTASLTIANGFTNNGLIELISADLGYSVTLAVTNGTLTNAAGATLRSAVGTGGTRTLAAQLDNQGTLDLLQALTINKASAVHTNSATINISAADLTVSQSGTTPSFTNTGTITLGASRDWTVTGGTLDIDQGTVTGPATSRLIVSNAAMAFTTGNVTLPLTLTNTTIVGGAVTIASTQTLTLLNGGLSDPVTVQNGGTLLSLGTVSLTGALSMPTGSTLRVRGQNIGSTANLTIATGFTNNGLVELITADLGYSVTLGITTGTLLNASGATLRSAVGTGGVRTLAAQLDNQGTFDVQQALTINKAGATHTNSATVNLTAADLTVTQTGAGASFTNTGTINLFANRDWTVTGGTLDVDQGFVTGATSSRLVVSNATIAFTPTTADLPLTLTNTTVAGGSVTIASGETVTLLNGGLSDPVTIQAGGTLLSLGTVSLTGALTMPSSSTLRVRGQNIGSTANLTIANGFTNAGLIELISADLGYAVTLAVTNGTLTNNFGATIRSSVGTGGTRTIAAQLANTGVLDVDQTLMLNKPGAAQYNGNAIDLTNANLTIVQTGAGASFGNGITGHILLGANRDFTVTGGAVNLVGSSVIDGSISALVTFSGVVLDMQGINSSPRINGVPVRMTGGTTILGGTLSVTSAQPMTLINSTLSDAVTVNAGAVLTTLGTTTINGAMSVVAGGAMIVRGQNNGTTANTTIASGFTNNGLIELTTADLGYAVTLNITSGTLTNASGATLQTTNGTGGTRTIVGNVVNDGSLFVAQGAHPNAIGTLAITGNFTQNDGGSLYMDLLSLSSTDRLAVSGTANVDGALVVSAVNGYDANPDSQQHTLITCGVSCAGAFNTPVDTPASAYPGGSWHTNYNNVVANTVGVARHD